MEIAAIVSTVAAVLQQIVQIGPTVIKGVEDATPFAQQIVALLEGGTATVSQADLDALTASIAQLSTQLQQPLPAPQPGDPDYQPPSA